VEADAEALVMSGLVKESMEALGYSRGFAVNQFHYDVTHAGEDRFDRIKRAYPEEVSKLKDFIDRIISVVGSLEQASLSAAAKTLYIARETGKALSSEEIKTLANDFGWKLSTSKINHVAQMLSQLKLVKVVDA
jgi:hypothetical protein